MTKQATFAKIAEAMAGNVTEALKRTLRCEKFPETLQHTKRIDETEKRFKSMGHWVQQYAVRMDKLAQKGEKFSASLNACSTHLQSEDGVKNSLSNYIVHLSAVQQQRTELKDILQDKISSDILEYKGKCRELRKTVKNCEDALRNKNHWLSELQKAKNRTPVDPRRINDANIKFEQARCQAECSREHIEEEMNYFEEQKLKDLNRILADFLLAEMRFHAQALQEYTAAFRCLPSLSEEEDGDDDGEAEDDHQHRGKSRGTNERKIAFSGSNETKPATSERARRRRSDSNDSRLSMRDLY